MPFDLHPEYPPEGIEVSQLSQRYGFDINAHHEQLFGENDLPHVAHERLPNSHAALNVAELARERGIGEGLHGRLMTAYWAENRDIGDAEVLVEEAAPFGLDPDEVRDAARTKPYAEHIGASTQAAQELGAGGVPAFVIADKIMIPGAQPHSLFEKVMAKLGQE